MTPRGTAVSTLLVVCTLASASFAVGFLAAVSPEVAQPAAAAGGPLSVERMLRPQHAVLSKPSPAATLSTSTEEAPTETSHAEHGSAVFERTLPFPFEQVLQVWEGGPPDPNFIREEVELRMKGGEEVRSKTLYTKNPLPWVLKKTVRLCLSFCNCLVAAV